MIEINEIQMKKVIVITEQNWKKKQSKIKFYADFSFFISNQNQDSEIKKNFGVISERDIICKYTFLFLFAN